MATSELIVFILGDSQPSRRMFSITAPAGASVDEVRYLVFAKAQDRFLGIDANDLALWKVGGFCSFPSLFYFVDKFISNC